MNLSPLMVSVMTACLLPVCLHLLLFQPLRSWLLARQMLRANHQGLVIPTAGGLILLLTVSLSLLALHLLGRQASIELPVLYQEGHIFWFIVGSLLISFWGFLDDRQDEREVKGFRGHLRRLWREGRMSSGMIKLCGGGATAFVISLPISPHFLALLVNTALIALCCNLINLFDLRPGRALKVFWLLLWLPYLFLVPPAATWLSMLVVLSATAMFFVADAGGEIMLGDTGANYLGFVLGYTLLGCELISKMAIVAALCAVHFAAEKVSFSAIIQSVPLLQKWDRWGVR